jgi:glycosyltransferase involved in cell wall biosynthesis
MKVRILTETQQRGTYATILIAYEKLKEKGIDTEFYTTFKSPYNVLPSPPKSKIFGEESMLNSEEYSERILNIISPEKNSIIHLANAWHGIIPIAEKRGVKTVINIQYWWPTCYFNSMEENGCDCKSILKVSKCIIHKKNGIRKLTSPAEAIYAIKKLDKIKKNVSSASAIIAVSKVVKDILIDRGYPEEKIKIININALTFNIDYIPYEPSEYFTFAYLSYPDREKGIFQLLRAFSLALKKNNKMILKLPGGLESNQVVEMVKELNIGDHVILTRRVPYEEYIKSLRNILKDVDFVVVPSLYIDTWGRVVIESMLAGRPTIVTKGNGGLIEQVMDGIDGFHVNTYDVNYFSEALYKISLMSREEVRKMGETARDNAYKKFDNNTIITQLVDLYREISE